MARLERFKEAQRSSHAGFAVALDEIRCGGKRGHWIWYVFPQLEGLGTSPAARVYAIADEEEAVAFLREPELRSRLLAIASAVASQLKTGPGKSLRALMGSDVDARKVVSSMTLFGEVARMLHDAEGGAEYGALATAADDVLAAAEAEGFSRCAYTLRRIRGAE